MAYVDIKYAAFSFEESPGLVTWLQLYLLKCLAEQVDAPAWTQTIGEQWALNAQVDIYKYFFDDSQLDDADREQWAITFLQKSLLKLNDLTVHEFGVLIGEALAHDVDYDRIKRILLNVLRMIQGKPPQPTLGQHD